MNIMLKEDTFEEIKYLDRNGAEYWSARDLMPILEYDRWENFLNVIHKAITACKNSNQIVTEHFREITKMIQTGKDAQRSIQDYELTKYACYLIAQNGYPGKRAIALAQTYFAVQTQKQEIYQQNKGEIERIVTRAKLRDTENRFAKEVMSRSVDDKGLQEIRSSGDTVLFGGRNTKEMKQRMGVETKKPLADHLPTVTLKAKDLATEMTTHNTRNKNLLGKDPIKLEHDSNNEEVRNSLTSRGIIPENLEPCEDVNVVEKRLQKQHGLKGKASGDINKLPDPNQDEMF